MHWAREVDAFTAGHSRWSALDAVRGGWNRAKELVSYEVLRESARRLRRALRSRPSAAGGSADALVVPERAVGDRQALRADGSLIYDGAFQRRSPLEVQEDAVRWAATNGPNLVRFRFSPERLRLLEALWRDLRARGVQIVAYIPPYHPAAWRVMLAEPRQREALDEMRAAIAGLAARMNVPFQDFADPATIPCAADEFFDAVHPRSSCLEKLLPRLSPRD